MADSADLLFRIKADGSQAVGEIDRVRGAVNKELNGIAQDFAASTGRVGQFAASLGPVGLALGATAGAAVAAGGAIFALAKQAADAGSKFNDLSLQTGLSVETLSGLQLQLKQSGTDMDALGRAAVLMQKNLGEAASGNKELQRAFAALGVKDVRAALADTDGTLRTLLKSLGEMQTAGERNAAGSKVMGRGFKELSVFLADTKGDLSGVIAESERAGRVMSTQAARAADEFGDQLDALTDAATVAGRNFGMEFVPEITKGMGDITGALQSNAGQWRAWGQEVANVLRGLMEFIRSDFAREFSSTMGFIWKWMTPLGIAGNSVGIIGAQARAGDVTGNAQDLANETARLRSKNAPAARPAADTSDFFSPAGGVRKAASETDRARKAFIETLHEWAEAFKIPHAALREIGAKGGHNVGSLHGRGLATDISPQYMTPEAIKGAERMGLLVKDERTRPKGQKVWTGAHFHVEALTKGMKAAQEVAAEAAKEVAKAFDEQEEALGRLARAIAEADAESQGFTKATADMQVAAEYARLGIGNLTGEAAELGEKMFAQREQQIRARVSVEEHVKALDALAEAMRDIGEIDMSSPLDALAAVEAHRGAHDIGLEPLSGPTVDPAGGGLAPPGGFSGDIFTEWGAKVGEVFGVAKEQAQGVGQIISSSFNSMAQAAGSAVKAFVLFGSAGGGFRKFAAEVIASVAQMAIVQAVWELAQGLAMTALSYFTGNPKYALSAGAHYSAAALYGTMGGIAVVAGRAVAGNAFAADAGGGSSGGLDSTGAAQRDHRGAPISEARTGGAPDPNVARSIAHVPITLTLDGKVLEQKMVHIYHENGEFRGTIRSDTLGEATSG